MSDSISSYILWETLKAVIRGEIISYSTAQNKSKIQEQQQLIDAIVTLDRQQSIFKINEKKVRTQDSIWSDTYRQNSAVLALVKRTFL